MVKKNKFHKQYSEDFEIMKKIVECVPNFSEGRDLGIIKKITDEIEKIDGITLLDVDPGDATNRTVVTFVGEPTPVKEAAFVCIKKAAELIDMRKHKGAHARSGATDVCPFVPVSGVTMEDCAKMAHEVGERVGKELDIPIYFYEHAATKPENQNLAVVRAGEYEGLSERFQNPDRQPDFGPAEWNEHVQKVGATNISAREFLIAYNINLNTRDPKLAKDIALSIREQGRLKRDKNKKIMRDANGNKLRVPGIFTHCKAVGWYIDEFNCAQISMNLTNYNITPAHKVFDKVCEMAAEKGLRVTGSELVGLLPKKAMTDAGKFFLNKQGKSAGVPAGELIRIAIQSMGLSELYPFKSEEKIIEYSIKTDTPKLVDFTIDGFVDELSTDSPAPGGGSVAALAGSIAAALGVMVANLTVGKKGMNDVWDEMKDIAERGQIIKDELLHLVDADTDAFNQMMAAARLPKKTDEQIAARSLAMLEANKVGINIPLSVMRTCSKVMEILETVAERGNPNSLSDAGVGALMLKSAILGASMNVSINLPGVEEDAEFTNHVKNEVKDIEKSTIERLTEFSYSVFERL